MSRAAKLRKKNGYWMTRAGGTEVYFGRVDETPYKDAQRAFGDHLKTLDDRPHRRTTVTCLEVCDRHLEWVQQNRSPGTYKQRLHFLERWCEFEVQRTGRRSKVGDLPYPHVSREDLQSWIGSLAEQGLLESSRRAAQTAVKACWNWAASDDGQFLLPKEFRPFASMPKVRVPPRSLAEDDLPTEQEIELLFKHADDDLGRIRGDKGRYRQRTSAESRKGEKNPYRGFLDILHVYCHTGARTSELAHIRVRHVLHRTRQVILEHHKRATTTRDPEVRRFALNAEVYGILDRHCRGQQPDDPVFMQSNGSPWNKDRLNDRFAKVRKRAGVRDGITIYSFRHLYISELLMSDNDITTVAKMAGTSVKMIETVYGHFRNEHFEQAQQKLDQDRERRRQKRRKV